LSRIAGERNRRRAELQLRTLHGRGVQVGGEQFPRRDKSDPDRLRGARNRPTTGAATKRPRFSVALLDPGGTAR
jgi:hypothetical protein